MRNLFCKKSGSSMLLAICIFLILVVLGINVLAASHSGVQNMQSKYEAEQTLQYLNSIYEIVDERIRAGEFELDGFLTVATGEKKVSETDKVDLSIGNGKKVNTYVEFYSTGYLNELKVKVYMKHEGVLYNITSVYAYNPGDAVQYVLKSCEGVTSLEE